MCLGMTMDVRNEQIPKERDVIAVLHITNLQLHMMQVNFIFLPGSFEVDFQGQTASLVFQRNSLLYYFPNADI